MSSQININYKGELVPCRVWHPTDGCIGDCSYDSETTLAKDGIVPDFVLGSAFNGKTVFFITQDSLAKFIIAHCQVQMFMANAAFDITVAEKICGSLLSLIDSECCIDILILRQLINLATVGKNEIGISLDKLAEGYLGLSLSKDAKDELGNDIRTSFGQFLAADGKADYARIPYEYLRYAGLDAIATFWIARKMLEEAAQCCARHRVSGNDLLSHSIQLKAAYALSDVSRRGLGIDLAKQSAVIEEISDRLVTLEALLSKDGWQPSAGPDTSLRQKMVLLEREFNFVLPRTRKGEPSVSSQHLENLQHIPFIKIYLEYKTSRKLLQFMNFTSNRVHPRFGVLVSTGRTSSFNPNVQQLPRDCRVRSIFVPSYHHIFYDVDYSQVELRTLAQITYRKFGFSKMRDLLNDRIDLHRYFASAVTAKPIDQISDEERRKAKACNFGFPGGLGLESFVSYAKNEYDLDLSHDEAEDLRNKWLEAFPEVRLYLELDELDLISKSGCFDQFGGFPGGIDKERAYWIMKGISSGQVRTKTTDREYTQDEIEWVFKVLKSVISDTEFAESLSRKSGSPRLWRMFTSCLNHIVFPSGRVRANVNYTASKNNPFQGIAADGAKEALYELTKSGFATVNFIHDEYLIEIPLSSNLRDCELKIKSILIDAMRRHCPDVVVDVEGKWMSRWGKNATHILDQDGMLVSLDKA